MPIFLGTLFVVICVLLIIVVLLQKGRGGGLGAAFGGMGSSAFGARTGDVFTWVTIVLTGLFLLLAVATTLLYRPPPDTVDRPVFDPPAKPISETTRVTMSCQTPKAAIYYTLDGSEPTDRSMPYQMAAVAVEAGRTLKARAYRPGWEPSEIAVGEYPDARKIATQTAPTTGASATR